MKEELSKIINNLNGFVLCIGDFDDKLIDIFSKNKNITELEILTNTSKISRKFQKKGGYKKTIYIQKLRKKYKKRNVNYIICDYNNIEEFSKYFVRESIGVSNKEVYIVGDKNLDVNLLKKRFGRYNTKMDEVDTKDGKILKVDVSKAKNNFIKDFFYLISDTLYNLSDYIGEVLAR